MPNKENIRHWVKALRSGRYLQGKNRLATRFMDPDGFPTDGPIRYCCLGVATEVAMAHGVPVMPIVPKARDAGITYEWASKSIYLAADQTSSTLPYPVVEWLGIGVTDPTLFRPDGKAWCGEPTCDLPHGESTAVACSTANDQLGLSFSEIADHLEATYLTEQA